MDATHTLEQWFEQADNALPVLTETARWVVLSLGVLLLLAGGKLLKAACIFGGLMLGMILGGLTLAFVDSAAVSIGFMVGLGLVGALGAWLIFRAWVAFAAAIVFAVAAPAAVLVFQGVPADELAKDTEQAAIQVQERYNAAVSQLSDETKTEVQKLIKQGDSQSLDKANSILNDHGVQAFEAAREIVFRNLDDISTWWQSKDSGSMRTIGMAMLIGGGIGFLLGLIMPSYAASLQAAMVGAVLIVIPGRELLVSHLPDAAAWTPTGSRGTLITIGLITVFGIAVQWTLHLRRDDK